MRNEINNNKIACVTGASGMIGLYITKQLLKMGYLVRVLTRNTTFTLEGVECFQGCLSDVNILESMLQGADVVFHCAAELRDESKMYAVNVEGTTQLLDILRRSTVRYFCYLSSAGVVGPVSLPMITEASDCFPKNKYEKTKYKAEKIVLHSGLNINTCILRPANVFDAQKKGVIGLAIESSLRSKMLLLFKGNEGAHVVHAQDVADAALFFMDKELKSPEIFFVSYDGDRRNTTLGVCQLYRAIHGLKAWHTRWALPAWLPYIVRKLLKGQSLHGRSRFSERKLQESGFQFPLGLEGALAKVPPVQQTEGFER